MSDVQAQLYYNAATKVVFGSDIPQTDPNVRGITATQVDNLKSQDGAGVDESALPLLSTLAAPTNAEAAAAEERGTAPAAVVEALPSQGAVQTPIDADALGNVSASGAPTPSSAVLAGDAPAPAASISTEGDTYATDPLGKVESDVTEGHAWVHAEILKIEAAFDHGIGLGKSLLRELREKVAAKL